MLTRLKQWLLDKILELTDKGDILEIWGKEYILVNESGRLVFLDKAEIRESAERVAETALSQFERHTPEEFAMPLDRFISAIDTPSIQELIYTWEYAAGLDRPEQPELPSEEERLRRISFIREELEELIEASEDDDLIEVADALADIVWVTYGTANVYGIDLDTIIREVSRSNYTKFKGGVTTDANGKLQKGEHYEPPEIEPLLEDM